MAVIVKKEQKPHQIFVRAYVETRGVSSRRSGRAAPSQAAPWRLRPAVRAFTGRGVPRRLI